MDPVSSPPSPARATDCDRERAARGSTRKINQKKFVRERFWRRHQQTATEIEISCARTLGVLPAARLRQSMARKTAHTTLPWDAGDTGPTEATHGRLRFCQSCDREILQQDARERKRAEGVAGWCVLRRATTERPHRGRELQELKHRGSHPMQRGLL